MAYFDFAQWLNLNRDQADALAQSSVGRLQGQAASLGQRLHSAETGGGAPQDWAGMASAGMDLSSQVNSLGTAEGRTQLLNGLSPGGNAATLGLDQILLGSGLAGGKYDDMLKAWGGADKAVFDSAGRVSDENARRSAAVAAEQKRKADEKSAQDKAYEDALGKMGVRSYGEAAGRRIYGDIAGGRPAPFTGGRFTHGGMVKTYGNNDPGYFEDLTADWAKRWGR